MPWARPSWCKQLAPNAPRAIITLQSMKGAPRQIDLGASTYYILPREAPNSDSTGEPCSFWHAAVLRNEQGDCFIMDLMSEEGTFMNKQKLESNKEYRWQPGEVVVLGRPTLHDKVTLRFDSASSSVAQKRSQEAIVNSQNDPASKRQLCDRSQPVKECKPANVASKCDKCDGPHRTDACPHFKKGREDHKDAWANYGNKHCKHETASEKFVLKRGREVRQPGDGSCLFHSLCFGLNGGQRGGRFNAHQLRKDLTRFIQQHPHLEVAGDTLEEWVRWDARTSVSNYTRRMAHGGWGGGIEMAACCLSQRVNVHVYERRRHGFERISCFNCPQKTKQTLHVLYQGGVHYDALVPC